MSNQNQRVEQHNIDISTASDADATSTAAQQKFGTGIFRYCCDKVFRNRFKKKEMKKEHDESSTFEECE
ncbi:hypothetical protein PVAND_014225 [Polypedilum vanderplanki]|uniref:Uncharacterized protein n=1 Tax=Polypedilum vanderplanki TaxID=319348 RepID=A0A9J6CTD0_POLVA|nr:hypothetical protein PVAND_014225 [Polypedilum vanderplanki]